MWIFNLILFFIFIVAAVALFYFNQGAVLDNLSLGFKDYKEISTNFVIFETFLIGAFWAFLFSVVQEIRLRIRISKLKKANKRLHAELNQSRTKPLDDINLEEE
ncbi:LapA family protein [bacterium]|nr:LapA family protein [bacterium]